MLKQDFITTIAEKTGIHKDTVSTVYQNIFELIEELLITENKYQIQNFGTFEIKERKEYEGYHPQSGEKMVIPSFKAISFRASKNLKDSINQK